MGRIDLDSIVLLSQAKMLLTSQEMVDEFGVKAFGVARLPPAWVPPTVLISTEISKLIRDSKETDALSIIKSSSKLFEEWAENLVENDGYILRSSATQETILDRGRYISLNLESLCPDRILTVASKICRDFYGKSASGHMGLLLQPKLVQKASGYLSNFKRVSKTRNQWQAEFTSLETAIVESQKGIRQEKFNSQRDDPPGELVSLQRSNTAPELKHCLKGIGSWLATNLDPVVSVEWVLDDRALWLVQCDDEVDPVGAVDPKQLSFSTLAKVQQKIPPEPFELYKVGAGSKLRKLKALDDFFLPNSQSLPEIYFAAASKVQKLFRNASNETLFAANLDDFSPTGVVIRTDLVDIKGAEGMNLPRTDTFNGLTTSSWLKTSIESLANQKVDLSTVFFLMHRFIPAKASAWSYSEPENRSVRIDSLWGIPDGIQYYPHDTFEYDLVEKRIVRPTIDFKPYLIWPSQSGKWTKLRVISKRGRSQSISKTDIEYIANYTAEVARKIKKPTQIMWFCDFPSKSNFSLPIPWYREQATQRPMQLDAAPPLPKIIIAAVQDALDVQANESLPRSKLILHPNSDEIRSEEYLNAVIEAAKSKNHSVVLDGSILAHAFHQFSKSGVSIFSSRKPSRRRTINKQQFGKLVRDKIPEIIIANGDAVKFGRVPRTEIRKLLIAKAFEELTELADAEEQSRVEELADLYEVFDAILTEFGLNWDSVIDAAGVKRNKRGGFSDGIVLVGTNIPKTTETSLLSSLTIEKLEVNPTQALNSASKIVKNSDGYAVPIIKLLSNDEGVLLKHKNIANGISLRLKLDGDRILLQPDDSLDDGLGKDALQMNVFLKDDDL